jgi:hypothetical protein
MKKIYTLGFVLMVLLSMTMSAAALQYKEKTLDNGGGAFAVWSDGSTNTNLDVFKTQGGTNIYVNICTADYSYCSKSGSLSILENVFDIDKKLNTATLSTVQIPLLNTSTGEYVETITIQAQWTGVGDPLKSSYTSTYKSGDLTTKFSSDTTFRDATATGAINDEELGTSQYASLNWFKSVSIMTIK